LTTVESFFGRKSPASFDEFRDPNPKFGLNRSGQASVEYILIVMVLILASYGAIRIIFAAWKTEFNKVSMQRCNPFP